MLKRCKSLPTLSQLWLTRNESPLRKTFYLPLASGRGNNIFRAPVTLFRAETHHHHSLAKCSAQQTAMRKAWKPRSELTAQEPRPALYKSTEQSDLVWESQTFLAQKFYKTMKAHQKTEREAPLLA